MSADQSKGFVKKKVKLTFDKLTCQYIRFKSFHKWPFEDDAECSASKMAEAGFFHCPTEQEPDLVQCFVCFKEFHGWDATDEPWAVHYSHSNVCAFAQLSKPQKDLTPEDIFEIQKERTININRQLLVLTQSLYDFRKVAKDREDVLQDMIGSLEAFLKR